MKQFKIIFTCLMICSFYLISSCRYDYPFPQPIDLDTPVSFSEDIIPIFSDYCTDAACHATGKVLPDLTPVNAYNQLMMLGYVDTTNAEGSLIYTRMDGKSNPMPPSGRLNDIYINNVLAWIKQGALNN
jgi:hypothetical protein